MGELIFGGISSKEIGLEVEHFPDFEIPERDYTVTHVPGRNGDVIWDNGSYKNVSRKYDISIGRFGMGDHITGSYENTSGITFYSGSTTHYQSIFHLLDKDLYVGSKIKIAFMLSEVTHVSVKINNDARTITTFTSVDQDVKVEKTIDVSSYGIDNITDISIAITPYEEEESVMMTLYTINIMSAKETYEQMAARVLNWLHQGSGYLRLEDSYEPSYYRLASYKENSNLSNILAQGGKATITFDCKPQRFLKQTQWIVSHAYHMGDPVKAFEERTYGFSPYMRVEIYPALDESDPDKASLNQPDEVWIAVRLDEEDEVIGTIKFLNIQPHIGRSQEVDDTLVIDIDFVYGKCLGIYKWANNVLVPYTSYSKTNFAFSVNMISAVMENKEMYYTARGIQYGEDDPYGTDELIVKMSCDMRRYLV